LSKPNIEKLRKTEIQAQDQKPKRIFKYGKGAGGDNSSFQQMMRQQMASTNAVKGPKKVDMNQYKEL